LRDNLKKENTMKTKVRIALVALLGVALFVVTLPISSAAPDNQEKQENERHHTKKGAEVGKRVRDLQKYNSRVRAALNIFEVNAKRHGHGHSPKLDESVSITRDPAGGSAALKSVLAPANPFRKVGFTPQADYSGYGFEMIFIPSYTTDTEWQGTVVINKFDPTGAYLGDYVADVVAISGPLNDVIQEVSYEDGQAYLQYGNPDFQFGTPIDSQDPGAIQPLISSLATSPFQNVSYSPQGIGWEAGNRPHPPTGGASPKIKWVLKCTTINTVAWGGVGCGVLALASAGSLFGPCAGAAASASFTACTLTAIFGG
jgi:hypothetical protein